jgi:hypothetical protein
MTKVVLFVVWRMTSLRQQNWFGVSLKALIRTPSVSGRQR